MKLPRMWLTLAAAAGLVLPAVSAPVPPRTSQGPISDVIHLRALLPRTAPLTVSPAQAIEDGVIELERRGMVYVTRKVVVNVSTPDGRVVQQEQTVTETVPQAMKTRMRTAACKFFAVGKDG